MKAEIINIGDELLIGQTVNTNAAWMGSFLTNLGISVSFSTVIADDETAILDALKIAEERSTLVLITGGLGPTKDDITKHTLCKYFESTLIVNQEVLKGIEDYFSKRNRPMLQTNIDQALVPDACTVLKNDLGTACGMLFEKNDCVFVSMPGVPYEMKHIMETGVLGYLKEKNKIGAIYNETVRTIGIGESFLAEIISEWETDIRNNGLKLAYLPSPGIVKLRISAHTKNQQENVSLVKQAIVKLETIIPHYIYGKGDTEIQQVIGETLLKYNKTIGICESCTGGYLSHLITSVSGCSNYYLGGIVSYTNKLKNKLLAVNNNHFTTVGAVSEEVVMEMVKGGLEVLQSDYCIGISGIAGPNGGTDEKPVGTIWVAVGSKSEIKTFKYTLSNNRERNIQMASIFALNELRKLIVEENS
jgi:nicotinamide-nucleotide amidase